MVLIVGIIALCFAILVTLVALMFENIRNNFERD